MQKCLDCYRGRIMPPEWLGELKKAREAFCQQHRQPEADPLPIDFQPGKPVVLPPGLAEMAAKYQPPDTGTLKSSLAGIASTPGKAGDPVSVQTGGSVTIGGSLPPGFFAAASAFAEKQITNALLPEWKAKAPKPAIDTKDTCNRITIRRSPDSEDAFTMADDLAIKDLAALLGCSYADAIREEFVNSFIGVNAEMVEYAKATLSMYARYWEKQITKPPANAPTDAQDCPDCEYYDFKAGLPQTTKKRILAKACALHSPGAAGKDVCWNCYAKKQTATCLKCGKTDLAPCNGCDTLKEMNAYCMVCPGNSITVSGALPLSPEPPKPKAPRHRAALGDEPEDLAPKPPAPRRRREI